MNLFYRSIERIRNRRRMKIKRSEVNYKFLEKLADKNQKR